MSKFSDIIDGHIPNIDNVRSGLVYTCLCGWIDLGHARPDNAAKLWKKIQTESGEGRTGGVWYRADFTESMSGWGLTVSETGSFAVRRGLSMKDKESVALAILLGVSHRFEKMQDSWPWKIRTDSGYSAEDLVSNLIGFYRAVRPGIPYVSECGPVSKAAAQAIWNKFGAVGTLKNPFVGPFLFPCAECKSSPGGPVSGALPPFLSLIQPAPEGGLYKRWDPSLVWEDPVQPLPLTLNFYVVQPGDSLSKIAARRYGNGLLWPLIFDSNRKIIGHNPDSIHPGARLLIPDLTHFSRQDLDAAEKRGRSRTVSIQPPR
jgi:LysM domain-containing protein